MPYKTISASVQYQQKIHRSLFHCFLYSIANAEEARILISAHNKEFANATHNCFAYICGFDREIQYYSDAGEPHGTAGKPMLNALLRSEMTFVLAIVTRYYGGVKLGVRGLTEAYGSSVELALDLAEKVMVQKLCRFVVSVDYSLVDVLTNLVTSMEGTILSSQWIERAELTLHIPETSRLKLLDFLDGFKQQSRLDYREEKT